MTDTQSSFDKKRATSDPSQRFSDQPKFPSVMEDPVDPTDIREKEKDIDESLLAAVATVLVNESDCQPSHAPCRDIIGGAQCRPKPITQCDSAGSRPLSVYRKDGTVVPMSGKEYPIPVTKTVPADATKAVAPQSSPVRSERKEVAIVKPKSGKSKRDLRKSKKIATKSLDERLADVDAKREKRAYANMRAANRVEKRNLKFATVEEVENFQNRAAELGFEAHVVKEEVQKPKDVSNPPVSTTTWHSRNFSLNRYCSNGYVGNSPLECLKGASSADTPDNLLCGRPWYYIVDSYECEDERNAVKLITRSESKVILRARFYSISQFRRMMCEFMFFTIWAIVAGCCCWFISHSDVLPCRLFGRYGLCGATATYLSDIHSLTCECPSLLRILMTLTVVMVIFAMLLSRFCFGLFHLFMGYAGFVRDPRFDAYINMAHVQYGLRQNADFSRNLISVKHKDKDYYPADTKTLFSSNTSLYFFLRFYYRCNIVVSSLEEKRLCEEHLVQPPDVLSKIKSLGMFLNAPLMGASRAFNFISAQLGNPDDTNVPPITYDNLCNAYGKRISVKAPREPLSDEQYLSLKGKLLNIIDDVTEFVSPDFEEGEIISYAEDFCKRKGLPKAQTISILKNARELETLTPDERAEVLYESLRMTKWFVKDETYECGKAPCLRFIINPALAVKLIFGSCLRPIEEMIYRAPEFSTHLIKHKTPEEIKTEFVNRFGGPGTYVETDYSSFESSIRWQEIKLENHLFQACMGFEVGYRTKILKIVEDYMCERKKMMRNKDFGVLIVDDIRLSGFPDTALGNAVLNYANIALACERANVDMIDYLVEGDDAMIKFASDADGNLFLARLDEQRFIAHDTEMYHDASDASFCGMRLVDGEIRPTKHQLDKFSIIFSREEPTLAKSFERMLSRIVCYDVKFPSMREELVDAFARLNEENPNRKIHTGKVTRLIGDDYTISQSLELTRRALDRLHEMQNGTFVVPVRL